MDCAVCDTIFICYHTAENPTDGEWDKMLTLFLGSLPTMRGVLIFSDGGGPNIAQRERLAEMIKLIPRTAMVTDSRVARGIMTALSWLGVTQSKTFPTSRIADALGYLGA